MARVSIITALHNKGPYVAETVRSVLAQTMCNWEMIVVENGSNDEGPAVVRQFSDPRIQLVVSSKRGPGAARNFGVLRATSPWVLFLDPDDLIEPNYLGERLALADSHSHTDLMVGCWEEFPDGHLEQRSLKTPAAFGQDIRKLEDAAIAYAPWALHAALVRKSRLAPPLLWPEKLDGTPSEDTGFWFPLLCGASVAWSKKAGALYRIHTTNSRNATTDVGRWVRATIRAVSHNIHALQFGGTPMTVQQIANIVRVMESNYRMALQRGDRGSAALALGQAQSLLRQARRAGFSMRARQILGLRLFNLLRFGII